MTQSVDTVPSQQAVKLVVVGPGFVEPPWFGLFWETSCNVNGVNWGSGFAIGDANTKIVP